MTPENVLFWLIYWVIGVGSALLIRRYKVLEINDGSSKFIHLGGGPSWSLVWAFRVLAWPLNLAFIGGVWAILGFVWIATREF